MEIRPPLGTPFTSITRKPDGKSGSRSGSTSNLTDVDAQNEERRANERVMQANHMAEEAERNAAYQVDQVKDEYDHRALLEAAREEQAYDDQRQKGYEVMRDLKRNQQAEISRVRRDGERTVSNLEGYYNATLRKLQSEGEQKLAQSERQSAQLIDYEKRNSMAELEGARAANRLQMETQMRNQEHQIHSLTDAYRAEYERMHENLENARQKSDVEFNEKYQATRRNQDETLGEISNRAAQKIKEIRQDTAAKLSAYGDRQRDPFYKLLSHDASLSEGWNEFTLTATIPEHEQKGITVSVKGNELVLTGYRRNEEKLELSPGRTQSSSSYQTFTESFPLTYPVDAKRLTKHFDGDQLIVTVPKLLDFQVTPQHQAKADPKKSQIERPDWPKNLPHVNDSHTPRSDDDDDGPKSSPKTTGSRTLD